MEHFEQWAALVRSTSGKPRTTAVLRFIDAFRSEWESAWSVASFPKGWWKSAPDQCATDVSLTARVVERLRDVDEPSRKELEKLTASCEALAASVNSESLYLGPRTPQALVYIGLLTALLRDVTKIPRPSDESPPDLEELIEALPDFCMDCPELMERAALSGLVQHDE